MEHATATACAAMRDPRGTRLACAPAHAPSLGRADDLAAVDAAWADARLVTVLGTGGLGKTTLVQEVGRRAQDDAGRRRRACKGKCSRNADVETAIASAFGLAHGSSARLATGSRASPTPGRTPSGSERS